MKTYIGVKIVQAEPLTLGEYNTRRGWKIPADEDPARAGFYLKYPDGYVSWSPREIFQGAYRLVSSEERGLVIAAPKPGNFYDRLLAESQELEERYDKLGAFIESDDFDRLPADDARDLLTQRGAMKDYREILGQRIAKLASSKPTTADEFPIEGEIKMTGGDKSETPVPFGGE